MGKPLIRKVNAALGVTLLLVGVVVVFVWAETRREVRAAARASRARELLAALDGLTADLGEARARRCAYLTRDDPAERDACRAAAGRVREQLDGLPALAHDDAVRSDLVNLAARAGQELDLLEQSLRQRGRGQFELTRHIQQVGEEFRGVLSALRSAQDQALAQQTQTARQSAEKAETEVGVGTLLIVLGLTVSGLVASHQFRVSARGGQEAAARLSEAQAALAELASLRGGLEEQLRQAQGLASVGRVTSGVAHDFNNLLTLILGYSEASLHSLPADDPARPFITEVVQAGRRAVTLTRQLLSAGRGGQPVPVDLNQRVADAAPLLRRLAGSGVKVETELAAEVGPVLAIPGQVDQVLLNLVANARDAMPDGGRLTLRTRRDDGAGHVVLAVTDTGCGMDAQTRARLFEPFFTTKGDKGTGLGMAIVHDAVRRCGGRLEVDSEVGRGTTVRIYLRPAVA